MTRKTRIAAWIEDLQSQGRYTFSREEAELLPGTTSIAVQSALRRLKHKRRIVSPRRGFYVIVPPEYRAAGCVPASWFIDDLMNFLHREYYVSLLSAAAIHGAGHQQPMAFQLVADGVVRPARAGRVRIEAHSSRHLHTAAIIRVQTETGSMAVATPETTALDLCRYAAAAGYWSHIAVVLAELAEKLEPELLLEAAAKRQLPDTQRLGYILEFLGWEDLAQPLASWLSRKRCSTIRLRSDKPAGDGKINRRFRVVANEHLEVER